LHVSDRKKTPVKGKKIKSSESPINTAGGYGGWGEAI